MQRCELIVSGKEGLVKKFMGECLTYSISVLPKLQFIGVSRANLKEKKPDFNFGFSLKTRILEELA